MNDKRADIFDAARKLFYAKGFKATNIAEIAKLAGIGVGTFYNYYPSKEKLFLEVYLKENEELKNRLFQSMNWEDDPVKLLTSMVTQNAIEMNSNPILREWYNKELFSRLEKEFYEHGGIGKFDEATHGIRIELIRKWKAEGKLRKDLDDEMINAIFTAIPFIDLHKSEIGIQHFPQILVHITEFIMKGLADGPKQ